MVGITRRKAIVRAHVMKATPPGSILQVFSFGQAEAPKSWRRDGDEEVMWRLFHSNGNLVGEYQFIINLLSIDY